MMRTLPVVTYACALAIGMIASIGFSLSWQSKTRRLSVPPAFSAVSPRWLNADERSALPVLDATTGIDDAKTADESLQRADIARLRLALPVIIQHPAPALRRRWLSVAFERWSALDYADAMAQAQTLVSTSLRLVALDACRAKDDLWVQSAKLAEPTLQMHSLQRYFNAQTTTTPLLCAERATTLREPFVRAMALRIVITKWSSADLRACAHWAQHLSDAATRSAATNLLIELHAKELKFEK